MFSLKLAFLHLVLGTIIGCTAARLMIPRPGPLPAISGIPSVEMIRNLSQLTTLRVDIADVEIAQISGWCGHIQAALLVKGDFYIGINLASAHFQTINRATHTAVLVLPAPTASSPRLDHQRSRLIVVRESGFWRFVPGDEGYIAVTNLAYEKAEQELTEDSHLAEHQQAARLQAEQVVRTFFSGIGWNVSIRWS